MINESAVPLDSQADDGFIGGGGSGAAKGANKMQILFGGETPEE